MLLCYHFIAKSISTRLSFSMIARSLHAFSRFVDADVTIPLPVRSPCQFVPYLVFIIHSRSESIPDFTVTRPAHGTVFSYYILPKLLDRHFIIFCVDPDASCRSSVGSTMRGQFLLQMISVWNATELT